MSVRKIEYVVSASGISPNVLQKIGVQGENKATELSFTLTDELYQQLQELKGNTGKVYYRFDINDSMGNTDRKSALELTNKTVNLLIENNITISGGNVTVYLIIDLINGNESKMEFISFPAHLRLERKTDLDGGRKTLTEMELNAVNAANLAVESKQKAENAAELAKNAKDLTLETALALEDGLTFIFNGGELTGDGQVDVDLVIDSELSEVSSNPVENKEVARNLKEKVEKNELIDSVFYVGFIITTFNEKNPGEIYGVGTWERFAKGRVLVGAGSGTDENEETRVFEAGETGGEYKHTLLEAEMPEHNHSLTNPNIDGKNTNYSIEYKSSAIGFQEALKTSNKGGNKSHNNVQPYVSVYMWIRTA